MNINKEILKDSYAIRLSASENGKEFARAYVYVLTNSLHHEPFGFLEDVFVEEKHRGGGVGTKIIKQAIKAAKEVGCYKLIGTSRNERPEVHRLYERIGFKKYGIEFRMDF
jgi:GNAT superfamily N-acetyltransferase